MAKSLENAFGIDLDWFLTGEGEMFLSSKPEKKELEPAGQREDHRVPLLRQRVSCGEGVDWQADDDNIEEYIDVLSLVPRLGTGRLYAFKADGSSMLGAGIKSGDYIIFNAEREPAYGNGIYIFALDDDMYYKWLEYDRLTNKVKVFSVWVAVFEKAELVRIIDLEDETQVDSFRIFGKVLCWIHPNMEG